MKQGTKMVVWGLGLGLSLLVMKIGFRIPNHLIWRLYLIISVVMMAGPIFNFCYNYRYSKKMHALLPFLKQGDTEKYITEVELLRRKARGRFANHLLTINASGAYCKCKRYDKAAHLLEGLPAEALSGVFKLVYCINLCLCYFYQKQTDKAMALCESSQSIFHNYRNSKSYGGNIAVLDIYAAIGRRDYARAEEMLQKAKTTWNDDRFSDDYAELENIIHSSPHLQEEQTGDNSGYNK